MRINLLGYKVENAVLRNTPTSDLVSLSFAFRYECKFDNENSMDRATGNLGILVHSAENIDSVESAAILIDINISADFEVFDSASELEMEKESLKVIFPYASSFITTLTANAHMAPLFVPILTPEDIEKQFDNPRPKKPARKRKASAK